MICAGNEMSTISGMVFEQISIQDNIVSKKLGRAFYILPFDSGSCSHAGNDICGPAAMFRIVITQRQP